MYYNTQNMEGFESAEQLPYDENFIRQKVYDAIKNAPSIYIRNY